MAIKRNKIKCDLASYGVYVFLGVPKVGKTTLTTKIAEVAYGTPDAQLLVSFADEEGYHSIDDILVERINDWDEDEYESETDFEEDGTPVKYRGFVQLVDELIETKKDNGFKIITLDTFDKMVEVGIKEVLRLSKKETGKKAKSLNDAMGGYGRGRDKLVELILEQINRLVNAKYCVFVIGHSKKKDMTDVLTGDSYEVITNNLRSDVYSQVANIAQMITMLTIERVIENGVQTGEQRMLNFRSNGLLDCGSRFSDLPEKLPLSAENFMKAFEQGVKGSMKKKLTDSEMKEKAIAESKLGEKAAENMQKKKHQEQPSVKELLSQIQKIVMSDESKATIAVNLMQSEGVANFTEMTVEQLSKILEAIK